MLELAILSNQSVRYELCGIFQNFLGIFPYLVWGQNSSNPQFSCFLFSFRIQSGERKIWTKLQFARKYSRPLSRHYGYKNTCSSLTKKFSNINYSISIQWGIFNLHCIFQKFLAINLKNVMRMVTNLSFIYKKIHYLSSGDNSMRVISPPWYFSEFLDHHFAPW